MPHQPVTAAVLHLLADIAQRLPAPRVARLHLPARADSECTGNHEAEFCALELEDGAFGLSYLLLGDTLQRLLAQHAVAGDSLAGADTWRIAQAFASDDGAARALALAAINAMTQSAWRRIGYQPPAAGNSLAGVRLMAGDHLGLIGGFPPLIDAVAEAGAQLTVLELDEAKVARLRARFPGVHATLDRAALTSCNRVVGSSTMLLNDTLDAMLAAAPAARDFALIGPSAGLWPDALFERGVTHLAGTQIVDGPAFADAMARGERWSHAARKFAVSRDQWPGWQRLLGA